MAHAAAAPFAARRGGHHHPRAGFTEEGVAANRFTLRYGEVERVFEVEAEGAHRMLGWRANDGEDVRLLRSARMPY